MNNEFSIPLSIALLSLVVALEPSEYFFRIVKLNFRWHRDVDIRKKLVTLGKSDESAYENVKITELFLSLASAALFGSLAILGMIPALTSVVLSLIGIVASILIIQWNLDRRCKKRVEEIEQEFPALVELLTLSVGSGESPASAFIRLAERGEGHLPREFKILLADFGAGVSFATALDLMSKRIEIQSLRRFVDTLVISISRGTPLVETLLHLTADARNREKSQLMVAAGKSEIKMMIPIVFLILPISILFALYPSIQNLQLFQN